MSTRTTRQRETLQERCIQRGVKTAGVVGHVRAELERLARQARNLANGSADQHYWNAIDDVLALLKSAKR